MISPDVPYEFSSARQNDSRAAIIRADSEQTAYLPSEARHIVQFERTADLHPRDLRSLNRKFFPVVAIELRRRVGKRREMENQFAAPP